MSRRSPQGWRPGATLVPGIVRDADRAAFMYTLIQTAKLNNVDPQAWLADALTRMLTSRKLRSANCSRDRDDKRGHRMASRRSFL
jgi:IS66 C-terminal element